MSKTMQAQLELQRFPLLRGTVATLSKPIF
jgi:hypothetical protein